MRRLNHRVIVLVAGLALLPLISQMAAAQQRRGRGGGRLFSVSKVQLAAIEKVQTELKLEDEQKTKVGEIRDQWQNDRRELFQAGRSGGFQSIRAKMEKMNQQAAAKLKEVLNDEQVRRLQEIYIQVNDAAVLRDVDVARTLKMTDEQKAKLDEAFAANSQALRDAFQGLREASAEQRAEKMTALRRESNERLLAVLTSEQREQLEKMKGAKVEIDRGQLFGRGRPRRPQ